MFQIVNFYKFTQLEELELLREELKGAMIDTGVRGTIILAAEGFNAMLCGRELEINAFLPKAAKTVGCEVDHKSSFHEEAPLRKIDVKIKPEIVTMKQPVDISLGEGTHIGVEEWNELISDPETVVLDARNYYEVKSGAFKNSIDPKIAKFSDLPKFIEENLADAKTKRVAMYCTGGIRCEKFTPYMRSRGFEQVFQLQGGILKYLEAIPPEDSLWNGECFVFDTRTTLNENLEKGVGKDHSLESLDHQ